MTDHAGGNEFIAGIGHATHCECYKTHIPVPLRYCWHHVLPQTCGGATKASNLVQVCDSCHYSIHALLYDLRMHNGVFTIFRRYANTARGKIATTGYQQAVALGTENKIPAEGSIG